MKGITVNTAPEAEPHIYAEDDAAVYQAIFGGAVLTVIPFIPAIYSSSPFTL